MVNITNKQVSNMLVAHNALPETNPNETVMYVGASVRYVLNGGNPYDSLRKPHADKAIGDYAAKVIRNAAIRSDVSELVPYQFIGFLADEYRREAGIIKADVDDYLNAVGVNHGSIGRLFLAEAIEYTIGYDDPYILGMLGGMHGLCVNTVSQAFRTALANSVCKDVHYAEFIRVAARRIQRLRDHDGKESSPRGLIGQIHKAMLSIGFDQDSEGFEELRYAVYASLSFNRKDRRPRLNVIYDKMYKKFGLNPSACKIVMDKAVLAAAIGDTSSQAIFRIHNMLRPEDATAYQIADEVLLEHGLGCKLNTRSYETLRTAVAILATGNEEFVAAAPLFRLVDEKFGRKPDSSYNYVRYILRGNKEFQLLHGNVLAFTKRMASAVKAKMQHVEIQIAA